MTSVLIISSYPYDKSGITIYTAKLIIELSEFLNKESISKIVYKQFSLSNIGNIYKEVLP
jgi:hypothetical protein